MSGTAKRRRRRRGPVSAAQRRWIDSAGAALARREAAKLATAVRLEIPPCGAKTRDGGTCRNPGTGAGNRCRRHGGATPSGAAWHRPVTHADPKKQASKLKSLAKRRARRAERLAKMTPAERDAFERRARGARPGAPAERAQRRRDQALREEWAREATESSTPEIEALDREIARLEALQREQRTNAAAATAPAKRPAAIDLATLNSEIDRLQAGPAARREEGNT